MKGTFYILIVLLAGVLNAYPQASSVGSAVKDQLAKYPESTLQDIYKSFFQDEFGPGHLLGDTSAARAYLRRELDEMESRGNYTADPCGAGQHFYRVPLDLVKDSIITDSEYFALFLDGAEAFRNPDPDEWKVIWEGIVNEIETMDFQIANFDEDRKALEEMLEKGEVVVHHSSTYNEKYHPHYRIFGIEQWNKLKEMMPGY